MLITKCIAIWLFVFMLMFFVLSFIGLLWMSSYKECISSVDWFVTYTLLIGWWLALIPTIEYYEIHDISQ